MPLETMAGDDTHRAPVALPFAVAEAAVGTALGTKGKAVEAPKEGEKEDFCRC